MIMPAGHYFVWK